VALSKQVGIGTSLLLALGPACLDGGLPAQTVSGISTMSTKMLTEHACAGDAWGSQGAGSWGSGPCPSCPPS
jgi:hypothetical protein